jgi:hypothetical protein
MGTFRRSIQQNLGIFEVSSIQAEFGDADTTLLQKAESTRPKDSLVTFKIGSKKLPLESYKVFHQGKIDDFGGGDYKFRILVKDRLWTLPEFPDTGIVNEDDFVNALPAHVGKRLPLCYGSHSLTSSDDASERGAWPTLFIDVTSSNRYFLIARHAVKSINEVYAFTPGRGSVTLTETTDYVAHKAGTINGETMAFISITSTGWTDKVTDANGTLGTVTVNVDGKEDGGDGTGELITNPIDVLKDLLENYLDNPTINSTKFDESKIVATTRSYEVRGGYTEEIATRQVLEELARSFSLRVYSDSEGKIAVDIFEPANPTTDIKKYREQWEILKGSLQISHNSDIASAEDAQIINTCDYEFDFHYAKRFFETADQFSDSTSVTNYGDKKFFISLPWNGNSNGAKDVAQRIVQQYRDPVATISFRTALTAMNSDLTDPIDVTHGDGTISGGYSDRRFEIISQTFNPRDFSIEISAKDVDKLSQNGFFLADEDTYLITDTGTAGVTNGDATITITSGPSSLIDEGLQAGDTFKLIDPTNEGNRLNGIVAAPITATTFEAEDSDGNPMTTWTTESGISYELHIGYANGDTTQKTYGHVCDETTEQFSDGDDGKVLL